MSGLSKCWCTACRPITVEDCRFVACPDCGNKRCPKAHNHANPCTNSNEPGQPGSSWEDVKPASMTGVGTDRPQHARLATEFSPEVFKAYQP